MIGADSRLHGKRRVADARGFTLMEMVVVLGLFSLTVATASDIFIMSNRAQRKVFSMERAQADARYTLEAMVREIRNDLVDYQYYSGTVPLPADSLALIDENSSQIVFEKSDAATGQYCADADSQPCLLVTVDGSAPAPITPKSVRLRNLKFYVAPYRDPSIYDATIDGFVSNLQQRVTVVMVLENTNQTEGLTITSVQATAAGRQFRR